jgi:thiamine pyrophosphate-dependent acetolactate synthase large subunit-like protein
MDRPGSVIGGGGAAALGSGLPKAVGIGLAAKREGGFCVDFNGDGDLFYVPTAMWTAVHHHIPVLVVALDNGGYIGEGGHVRWTAEVRDRSNANQHICTEIQRPRIDIAALARAQGAYAEGPIERPDELGPAIARAVRVMQEESTMAVVAVRCE